MCKIYDAIENIAKLSACPCLKVWISHAMIQGTFVSSKEQKTFEGILSIKDAQIFCKDKVKEFNMLNIPTSQIKCFSFDCECEVCDC